MLPKSGGTLTGVLQLPTGSVSTPALNVGDTGTGLFKPSSNVLGITADGTQKINVKSTATEFFGNATSGAKVRFYEGSNQGNQYVEFKAKNAIPDTGSNLVFTLPFQDGSNGDALLTNGAGELSFGAPTVGAADLTGNTLASGVTASSLTSVGTLTSLTSSGTFTGTDLVLSAEILLGGAVGTAVDHRYFKAQIGTTKVFEIRSVEGGDTNPKTIASFEHDGTDGKVTADKFIGDGSALTGINVLPNVVHARRTSNFGTTSSTYQEAVSVTIDPIQTNSKLLVIAVGAAIGVYGGTSSGQQATGATNIFRGSTEVGEELFHNRSTGGSTYSPLSQAFLDTTNHGGNTVTFSLRLRRASGGSKTVTMQQGASIIVMEVT